MRWMSAAVDQGCAIMSSAPNKGFCPCSEINTHPCARTRLHRWAHKLWYTHTHTHVSSTHTYLLRLLHPGSCYLSQANSLVSLVKLQLINLAPLCSVCLRVCIAQIGREGSVRKNSSLEIKFFRPCKCRSAGRRLCFAGV